MSVDTATIRNGVNTEQMYGTLDLIKDQPALAQFQFRVSNRWIEGAHNRSTIQGFYGAGAEDTSRTEAFALDAGEPKVLLGENTGPNPVEFLLHARGDPGRPSEPGGVDDRIRLAVAEAGGLRSGSRGDG